MKPRLMIKTLWADLILCSIIYFPTSRWGGVKFHSLKGLYQKQFFLLNITFLMVMQFRKANFGQRGLLKPPTLETSGLARTTNDTKFWSSCFQTPPKKMTSLPYKVWLLNDRKIQWWLIIQNILKLKIFDVQFLIYNPWQSLSLCDCILVTIIQYMCFDLAIQDNKDNGRDNPDKWRCIQYQTLSRMYPPLVFIVHYLFKLFIIYYLSFSRMYPPH